MPFVLQIVHAQTLCVSVAPFTRRKPRRVEQLATLHDTKFNDNTSTVTRHMIRCDTRSRPERLAEALRIRDTEEHDYCGIQQKRDISV